MTQQFKFGDIVRDASLGVCVVINTSEHFAYIMNSRGNYNTLANPADLEYVPHPDTVRLDWLIKRNFDFQKCYDMGGRWWYEDNSFDEIEGTEGMTEREAIDTAMQAQAAEAEAT